MKQIVFYFTQIYILLITEFQFFKITRTFIFYAVGYPFTYTVHNYVVHSHE